MSLWEVGDTLWKAWFPSQSWLTSYPTPSCPCLAVTAYDKDRVPCVLTWQCPNGDFTVLPPETCVTCSYFPLKSVLQALQFFSGIVCLSMRAGLCVLQSHTPKCP